MKKITRLFLMPAALICLSQAAFAGPNTVWGGPLKMRYTDGKVLMMCDGPIVMACYELTRYIPTLSWKIAGTTEEGEEIHATTAEGQTINLDEEGRQIGEIEIILDREGN